MNNNSGGYGRMTRMVGGFGFIVVILSIMSIGTSQVLAQSPVGLWKQISLNKDTATSIIKIYEEDGDLHGKVVRLLPAAETIVCHECEGKRKGQPLEGMEIMWDVEPHKDFWKGGKILAPKRGKVYNCLLRLKDKNTLEVRGYLGVPALGKSEEWVRLD